MIDGIPALVEKIVQLLETREKQSRRYLEEVVEPLYRQVDVVHNGYLAGLDKCLTIIAGAGDTAKLWNTVRDTVVSDMLLATDARVRLYDIALASKRHEFSAAVVYYLGDTQCGLATWRLRQGYSQDLFGSPNTRRIGLLNKCHDILFEYQHDKEDQEFYEYSRYAHYIFPSQKTGDARFAKPLPMTEELLSRIRGEVLGAINELQERKIWIDRIFLVEKQRLLKTPKA